MGWGTCSACSLLMGYARIIAEATFRKSHYWHQDLRFDRKYSFIEKYRTALEMIVSRIEATSDGGFFSPSSYYPSLLISLG